MLDACLLAYLSWAKSRIDRAENAYWLLPWVSVNYRGELVRRDRQKGGERVGGAFLSLQNTIEIKQIQKYLRYGHYLRP